MNDTLLAVVLAGLALAVALLALHVRALGRKLDAVAVLLAAGEPTPEEVAAISAAVTVALSGPVRIHHIRVLPDDQQAAWSRIGRLDLMRSHAGSGRQG
jgi:hypothetical protein